MRRARGFTLVEMALCISIGTLVVPLVLLTVRSMERQHLRALEQVESAQAMRGVSEELRRDLQSMRMLPGPAVALEGACGRVDYVVSGEAVLQRRAEPACGGTRAVARRVKAIRREAGQALSVDFERPVAPGAPATTSIRFAW